MTRSADYVFGGEQNELERLLGQAADLKPETSWLLDRIGVGRGWRAADVGCGPIGILDLLSEHVGPEGAVVGVEREPRFAAMARTEIERRSLQNVLIVEGDMLAAELDEGSFDLVHERLVLINVPEDDRGSIVAAMLRLARPGGTLALESWDRASHVCYPEHPAWQILNDAYREAVRTTIGAGTSGRTLPWLLRSAGVIDVHTKVHVRAVEVGDRRRTHRLGILDVAKARILATGRLSEAEFDAHRAALAEHLANPDTLLIDQLFVQAWGTKPR
ncbi:methyltransferase domain-containing protein [Belnapia sp. T6]|uniref:Methyltransferase domain-containing protein n=1 Tax=Belnapia mucosa TaxID=2804532 RepID=A0ABS1VCC4_9PROT|nr:methyltransferase domain-containing protein [Belnapia mucosa]MBL6459267.1 methyltransferase domain-containing protein [Belnapia mucosa]